MLSPTRFVIPVVRHLGYFDNPADGFSNCSGENNRAIAENTIIGCNVMCKKYTFGIYNSIYCFSNGLEDEVIVTVYEQFSKRGMIAYLQEKSFVQDRDFAKINTFVTSFNDTHMKRFFVTLTGGATLSSNALAKKIKWALSPLKAASIIWNTWHWLPHRWRTCYHTAWIVRFDLDNGSVRSFETPYLKLDNYMEVRGFLSEVRRLYGIKCLDYVEDWFRYHPLMLESQTRVTDLFKKYAFGFYYNHTFFQPDRKINSFIFLYYPSTLVGLTPREILSRAGTMDVKYIILYPSSKVVLPTGPEENVTPAFTRGFEEEDINSSTVTRRKNTRTVANVPEQKVAAPSRETPVQFRILEGDTFREQIAVLHSYGANASKTALARIQSIRQDLVSGRLPEKMVGGYYVCDVPGLGGTGRGAWRLLIARKNNTLTLTCIADYHQNRFRVWS